MQHLSNGIHQFVKVHKDEFKHTTKRLTVDADPYLILCKIKWIEQQLFLQRLSFDELTQHFFDIIKVLPLPMVVLETEHMVRCRPGYYDNGKIYSNVSEISYNPFAATGRFNIKHEPIFYGSMPSGAKNGDCSLTAMVESDKDLLNKKAPVIQDKFATLGRWDIQQPITVINASFLPQTQEQNPLIAKLNRNVLFEAYKVFDPQSAELFILFCLFLSNVSVIDSPDNAYIVTNAFKRAISWYYGSEIKGFVYSSKMAEHNGINIALSKDVVDDGYITLTGAGVYKIQSHAIKFQKSFYPCSNFARTDHYGNFKLNINFNMQMFG